MQFKFTIPTLFTFFFLLSLSFACNRKSNPSSSTDSKRTETVTSCVDSTKIDRFKACPRIYRPVCGCDKKTYPNDCEAQKAGVTEWTEGPCKPCIDPRLINSKEGCPEIYKPVCGCDGKTYPNACEAENMGITLWVEGECGN